MLLVVLRPGDVDALLVVAARAVAVHPAQLRAVRDRQRVRLLALAREAVLVVLVQAVLELGLDEVNVVVRVARLALAFEAYLRRAEAAPDAPTRFVHRVRGRGGRHLRPTARLLPVVRALPARRPDVSQ